jgi:hypothetical protein
MPKCTRLRQLLKSAALTLQRRLNMIARRMEVVVAQEHRMQQPAIERPEEPKLESQPVRQPWSTPIVEMMNVSDVTRTLMGSGSDTGGLGS